MGDRPGNGWGRRGRHPHSGRPVDDHVGAGPRRDKQRDLDEAEDEADDEPGHDEGDEHPEQERRLADRQPRQWPLLEQREPRAPSGLAMSVVLGDLTAHGAGGILRGLTIRIREGHRGCRCAATRFALNRSHNL
jgi:hypothetical protein